MFNTTPIGFFLRSFIISLHFIISVAAGKFGFVTKIISLLALIVSRASLPKPGEESKSIISTFLWSFLITSFSFEGSIPTNSPNFMDAGIIFIPLG